MRPDGDSLLKGVGSFEGLDDLWYNCAYIHSYIVNDSLDEVQSSST